MEQGKSLGVVVLVTIALLLASKRLSSQVLPSSSPAAALQVLLLPSGTTSSTPTTQQVVDGFQSGSYTMQGFSAPNKPDSVAYLLPRRAQGDFLAYLSANPNTARAKLERMVVTTYSSNSAMQKALSSLQSDPNVQGVLPIGTYQFSTVQLQSFDVESSAATPIVGNQYGRTDLNVDAAWALAGGYALIADIDSGLATTHPDLIAFSATGQFLGGNFLSVYAYDISSPYGPDKVTPTDTSNVDEEKLVGVSGTSCDIDGTHYAKTTYAGHGTHVAGLIAANSLTADGLAGTCANCGIAEWKISNYVCQRGKLYPQLVGTSIAPAVTYATDVGAQVINQSFGQSLNAIADYCATYPADAQCLALQYATTLDVILTAASGNNRVQIQFPASDSRVIATGGFDQNIAFWDFSPGSTTNCPSPSVTNETLGSECGSNFTTASPVGQKKQELVAAANGVESTVYPNSIWNLYGCGDSYLAPSTDGIGLCTGTSMSAPQVAGIAGILRSINPLVRVGDPNVGGALGIRNVLVNSTVEAQHGTGWDSKFGYGRPDAAAAARLMLGKADGVTVKNRATPLFSLYSSAGADHAYTTSPQTAVALIRNVAHGYIPQGTLVAGYSLFPSDPHGTPIPALARTSLCSLRSSSPDRLTRALSLSTC